jgi:hypothetical protein
MKILIYVRESELENLNEFINSVPSDHDIDFSTIMQYSMIGVLIDYDQYVNLIEWKS